MNLKATQTAERVENGLAPDACEVLNPSRVLQELFELLEAYGPLWYTEELRERTLTALSTK